MRPCDRQGSRSQKVTDGPVEETRTDIPRQCPDTREQCLAWQGPGGSGEREARGNFQGTKNHGHRAKTVSKSQARSPHGSRKHKELACVSLVIPHVGLESGRGPETESTQALTTTKLTTSGWGVGEATLSQSRRARHSFEG